MAIKHTYEFWAKDKDGKEYHDFFSYTSTRDKKVKEYIEKKFNIDISECEVFDYRRTHDI